MTIDTYFRERVSEEDVDEIVSGIADIATMRADPQAIEPILRDPGDDYLVALAREGGAEAIVTGDKDLLDHDGLRPTALSAREACELLGLL